MSRRVFAFLVPTMSSLPTAEHLAAADDPAAQAPRPTAPPVPDVLLPLAAAVRGKRFEAAKRALVARTGSVQPREAFDDEVADAVFARLQQRAQVGAFTDERDLAHRRPRRLAGDGEITLYRAAPRGASMRPGDFAAGSAHEAGFYTHRGNVVQQFSVKRSDVIAVDGSMGGGQEYVFLPPGHQAEVAQTFFSSFRQFFDAAQAQPTAQAAAQPPASPAPTAPPLLDSRGTPVHATPQGEAAFARWFEGSRIVDSQGRPLVVYHGTASDFDAFKSHERYAEKKLYVDGVLRPKANGWDMGDDRAGVPEGIHYGAWTDALTMGAQEALEFRLAEAKRYGSEQDPDTARHLKDLAALIGASVEWRAESHPTGDGFYFSPAPYYAAAFSGGRDNDLREGGQLMPVYLAIRNPVYLDAGAIEGAGIAERMARYRAQGHDGAIYVPPQMFGSGVMPLETQMGSQSAQIVAFEPTQIKSALSNSGAFDPADERITFSRGPASAAAPSSSPPPRGVARDPERLAAEARAVARGAKPRRVRALSDNGLRQLLVSQRQSVPARPMPSAKAATLSSLGLSEDRLYERHRITVADDGLIEVEVVTPAAARLIGERPVALYHHTATALLPAIADEGLRVGAQTNFFNSQAGVYLSTIAGGQPVDIYSQRAAKVHGGEPVTLRVRRRLSELTPDPDDADIAWAQGRQFVSAPVPAGDVLFDEPQRRAAASRSHRADIDWDDALARHLEAATAAQAQVAAALGSRVHLSEAVTASSRARQARSALAEWIASGPDDALALQGTDSQGQLRMLTASAQRPGQWQITRFDSDGEPMGDGQRPSKLRAIDDFLQEIELRSLVVAPESRPRPALEPSTRPSSEAQARRVGLLDSRGQPVHATAAGAAAFEHWFANSKVVDADGRPLVLYHGTGKDVEQFKRRPRAWAANNVWGHFFTRSPGNASAYSGEAAGANVMPVYLSLQNPYIMPWQEWQHFNTEQYRGEAATLKKRLLAEGYDGISDNAGMEFVAFRPEQIKSAIGNNGAFDPNDPRIAFARGAPDSRLRPAREPSTRPSSEAQARRVGLLDSRGQPVHATAAGAAAFEHWFTDSKVVDADGRPLVVYHGTATDFAAFDNARTAANDRGLWGRGHYFSASVENANSYALRQGDGARIVAAYVAIKNPLILQTSNDLVTRLPDGRDTKALVGPNLDGAKIKELALAGGHDGVIQLRPNGMIGDLVAYTPQQIKSAIGNNGEFDPNDPRIAFARAAPFYSELAKQVEASPVKQGTAGAWTQYLDALAKRGAVKADEIEWTGLREWLGMQPGKVGKDAIAEFLRGNGVQVQEVTLGDRSLPDGWTVKGLGDTRGFRFAVLDESGEEMGVGNTRQEAIESAQDDHADDTKYGRYTLPGGQNYREVLLTLPSRADTLQVVLHPDYSNDTDYALQKQDGSFVMNEHTGRPMRWDSRDLAERYGKQTYDEARKEQYRSSHWDQPNILAHIRLNERTDAEGKRVLFVEELQSDWAQEGKRKGFRQPFTGKAPTVRGEQMTVREFVAIDPDGQDWLERQNAMRADLNDPPLQDSDPVQVIFEDGKISRATTRIRGTAQQWAEQIARDWQRIRSTEAQAHAAQNIDKVQPAPFVSSTDKWVALAIKRVITMAVQEGYDRVAFVTGEQSAKRYDLSEQVDSITARALDGGKFVIYANKDGEQAFKKITTRDAMPDLIGKELAKRILADCGMHPLGQGEFKRTYRGQDLSVGGEGMRAFYEKIVPSVAKDVLKKLGGGTLVTVPLRGEPVTYDVRKSFVIPNTWMAEGTDGSQRGGTEAEVRQWVAEQKPRDLQQLGFDITDGMRERASGGLPLFARNGADSPQPLTPPLDVDQVRAIAHRVAGTWSNPPQIRVIASIDDAPERVREWVASTKASGADGTVRGFVASDASTAQTARSGPCVWLVANALSDVQTLVTTLTHETVGHYGLRAAFGDRLRPALIEFAHARPDLVAAKAKVEGLDLSIERERLLAAEEVLAEWAQSRPRARWCRSAVAGVRQWLREHAPGWASWAREALPGQPWIAQQLARMEPRLSDADLIERFITPAHHFLAGRRPQAAVKVEAAMPADLVSIALERAAPRSSAAEAPAHAPRRRLLSAQRALAWLQGAATPAQAETGAAPDSITAPRCRP